MLVTSPTSKNDLLETIPKHSYVNLLLSSLIMFAGLPEFLLYIEKITFMFSLRCASIGYTFGGLLAYVLRGQWLARAASCISCIAFLYVALYI